MLSGGGGVSFKQHSDCVLDSVEKEKACKKSFTLVEAIVVLTILGIIAAISIPGILQNQRNAAERTKLKKVIVDFEKLISNMTIENDIQSIDALEEYANTTDCPNSRKYFKINKENDSSDATVSGHGKCVFRATDGVWWDISDITRPVVSLDGIDKLSNIDGQNAFLLTTTFNDDAKAFVVNDVKSSSLSKTEKEQLQKTLAFADNKTVTEEETPTRTFYPNACANSNSNFGRCTNCKACSTDYYGSIYEYDEDGNYVAYYSGCTNTEKREGCYVFIDPTGYAYSGCEDAVNKVGCAYCYDSNRNSISCP